MRVVMLVTCVYSNMVSNLVRYPGQQFSVG